MLKTLSEGILVFIAHKEITLILAGFFLLLVSVIFVPLKKGEKPRLALFLVVFFSLSIPLRLAYLRDVSVPSYFDSVAHIRIANALMEGFKHHDLPSLSSLTAGYYHLGFHWLVSLLALGLRADLIDVMLILGQITLAALPIPLFLLIYQHTTSKSAALLTAILAGFGWYMPSLLIDWGKYPALTSLLAFEFSLLYAYVSFVQKGARKGRFIILFLLISLTVLFHTRMLIVVGVTLLSWTFGAKTATLLPRYQAPILRIQLLLLLIFGLLIQQDPLLTLTLEPYFLKPGLYATALIFFFSLFARQRYPRAFYFSLFLMLGFLIALFIPLPAWGVDLPAQRLLDRPFVEMLFHLPLSLLAGIAFAASRSRMTKTIKTLWMRTIGNFLILGLLGLLSLFMLEHHRFFPSGCCTLVKNTDIVMLDWIDHNLPADARILVAADPLEVMPGKSSSDLVGSDAGIWIPYFTHRRVLRYPYTADFSSLQTKQFLCDAQINYIYLGHGAESFPQAVFDANQDYRSLVSIVNTALYEMVGCP